MLYSLKLFLSDRWIYLVGLLTFGLMVITWWYTALHITPTEDLIFLHYNVVFGTDLVGTWKRALIPPGVGSGVFVINTILAFAFYGTNRLVGRLLMLIALGITASILTGQILMLNLNL